MDLLQRVQIGQAKVGQKVKFLNKKAWWKVVKRDSNKNETTIKRGSSTWYLSNNTLMLQELFDNL